MTKLQRRQMTPTTTLFSGQGATRQRSIFAGKRAAMMSHKGEYLLRRVPPILWRQVKRVADEEGHTIREVILRKLEEYVLTGFHQVERRDTVEAAPVTKECPICGNNPDGYCNGGHGSPETGETQMQHDIKASAHEI